MKLTFRSTEPSLPTASTAACGAGVDFGSQSAKVVLATASGSPRIVASCRLVYPAEIVGDPIKQAAFVAEWVDQWSAATVRKAHCALPLSLTDYEATDLAPSQTDPDQAAAEKLGQVLGGGAAQVTADHWVTSCPDRPQRLHVLWASRDLAAGVTREMVRRRLPCRSLSASPATLGIVATASGEGARLIVDLGVNSSAFAFVESGVVTYARPRVAIRTSEALATLTALLGVSPWAAETMVAEWGCIPGGGPIADSVQKSFAPWLRSLRFELQRTLGYLDGVGSSAHPTEVLLCGGGAELRGADRWLSEQLGLTVKTCPPPAAAEWHAAEPYSPVFATAAALAVSGGSA